MEEGLLEEQSCKLNYTFIFWFSYFKENKQKQINDYEDNLRKIGSFNTAEEFWGYYQHIRRPDSLPKGCEFLLFKEGIQPLWEDPANHGGGRFVLHIKKIFSTKTWEDILLAFIITEENFDKLNGVVINVRGWEVLLSIWTKELNTEEELEKYKKWIRNSLGMTENIKIDYKPFPNPEEMKKRADEETNASRDSKADAQKVELKKSSDDAENKEEKLEAITEEVDPDTPALK